MSFWYFEILFLCFCLSPDEFLLFFYSFSFFTGCSTMHRFAFQHVGTDDLQSVCQQMNWQEISEPPRTIVHFYLPTAISDDLIGSKHAN